MIVPILLTEHQSERERAAMNGFGLLGVDLRLAGPDIRGLRRCARITDEDELCQQEDDQLESPHEV